MISYNTTIFQQIVEGITDGVLLLNRKWTIRYVNEAAAGMLGRSAKDLLEKNIWNEFPEAKGKSFYQGYKKALKTGQRVFVEDYSAVLHRWTSAAIYPLKKDIAVYFHDLTAQRLAEKQAAESEQQYKTFLDRITDGFIALDKKFNYTYVNKKVGDLVKRDPLSLIGRNVWEEFPEAVHSFTYKSFLTAMREQRFISSIDYYPPLDLWQENYIYPSPEGLSVFIKDISDRKKLEKELHEHQRNKQFEIMITALEAEEKERNSIGQELHDNVNQLLVATRLMLAILRDDPENVTPDMLSRCISNIETVITENRRISHELVTPDLDDKSLVEKLTELTHAMLTAKGIQAVLDVSGFDEQYLDRTRRLTLYRIAQEQCTNVIKHADAHLVRMRLFTEDGQVNFAIADDGKGVSKKKVQQGIGLNNIRGRAAFYGGCVNVETGKGKGFALSVTLPLQTHTVMEV